METSKIRLHSDSQIVLLTQRRNVWFVQFRNYTGRKIHSNMDDLSNGWLIVETVVSPRRRRSGLISFWMRKDGNNVITDDSDSLSTIKEREPVIV